MTHHLSLILFSQRAKEVEEARAATDVKKTIKAETRALMMKKKTMTRAKLFELSESIRNKSRTSERDPLDSPSLACPGPGPGSGSDDPSRQPAALTASRNSLLGSSSHALGSSLQLGSSSHVSDERAGVRVPYRVPTSIEEVRVIVKADVQGSLEAILSSLKELEGMVLGVKVKVLQSGLCDQVPSPSFTHHTLSHTFPITPVWCHSPSFTDPTLSLSHTLSHTFPITISLSHRSGTTDPLRDQHRNGGSGPPDCLQPRGGVCR